MKQLFFFFCLGHHHHPHHHRMLNVTLNAASLTLASRIGMKPFKCNVCAASFTTNGSLNRHMIIHAKSFKCSVCDESFRSSLLCKKHMKKEHSMDDQSRDTHRRDINGKKCLKTCRKNSSILLFLNWDHFLHRCLKDLIQDPAFKPLDILRKCFFNFLYSHLP